jgi:hypothetical protein
MLNGEGHYTGGKAVAAHYWGFIDQLPAARLLTFFPLAKRRIAGAATLS